jgi:hypothetical protein
MAGQRGTVLEVFQIVAILCYHFAVRHFFCCVEGNAAILAGFPVGAAYEGLTFVVWASDSSEDSRFS